MFRSFSFTISIGFSNGGGGGGAQISVCWWRGVSQLSVCMMGGGGGGVGDVSGYYLNCVNTLCVILTEACAF